MCVRVRVRPQVGHDEQWAVEPSKVVGQLLLPSAKVPSNAWETFLLAAADGDGKGMWFVLSPSVIKVRQEEAAVA